MEDVTGWREGGPSAKAAVIAALLSLSPLYTTQPSGAHRPLLPTGELRPLIEQNAAKETIVNDYLYIIYMIALGMLCVPAVARFPYLVRYRTVQYLTLCRAGLTGLIFFVVRYPRYLAYVRDAGRGRPNTSSQIRRTPDGSPTSTQRDAKSTPTTNRCIARQLLMPRSQRNIVRRSSAAVDVDFGLRRRRRRAIVDIRE